MYMDCLTGLRGEDSHCEEELFKKRRYRQRCVQSDPAMSSSTRTSPTSMTFTERLQPREVLINLNEQRSDVASHDVIVRSSSSVEPVYAHRCILAASSDYFKALFHHDLTDAEVIEAVIPGSSHDTIEKVVTFIYTGAIEISGYTVEEIVRLADYLGVQKILEICGRFMEAKLDDGNCLEFKVLSEIYPLGTLSSSVQTYILPRMSTLVRRSDTVYRPVDVLRQLLSDDQTNYAREADVLKLIQDVIANRTEMNPLEKEKARDLLDCVEFEYLPLEVIEREVISNADTLDWLRTRPELLESVVRGMGERYRERGRDVVDAILCQGGTSKRREDLQVMLYLVKDDAWRVLRQPQDATGSSLCPELEAMVTCDGFLYALSSSSDNANGYKETKYFNRLDLQTCTWFVLQSPGLVTRETKFVSAGPDLLLAIDGTGKVERYVTSERRWMDYCCTGFPGWNNGSRCFLPMPSCSELYVLRTFSAGYPVKRYLSIYRLDAVPSGSDSGGHSWNELTQMDITKLSGMGEDVKFFGYSIAPGLISIKDELGHILAQFDTAEAKWMRLWMRVPRSGFILNNINGSAECSSRVYFVARSTVDYDNIFVMLDHAKGRFKMTDAPPYPVSGLLFHVALPATSVESLCRED